MACVVGGGFTRGIDHDAHVCRQGGQSASGRASLGRAAIAVSPFFMDVHEVTTDDYRRCVKEGPCRPAAPIYPGFDATALPVTGVSWHDAAAYCKWANKRLPTEAEWERAARLPSSGAEDAAHPWGNEPATCERAVIENDAGRGCGERGVPTVRSPLPVGSRPAGAFGLFDMLGNAEEWVADWWSEEGDASCLGRDPQGPCGGAAFCANHPFKVVKGGSWYWPAEHATAHHRRRHLPNNPREMFHHFGFRCARTP
jgi:formylglycine-generating enzyme required for sulfatase activity